LQVASLLRLRPIIMTALVACLGLLPAALSTGANIFVFETQLVDVREEDDGKLKRPGSDLQNISITGNHFIQRGVNEKAEKEA